MSPIIVCACFLRIIPSPHSFACHVVVTYPNLAVVAEKIIEKISVLSLRSNIDKVRALKQFAFVFGLCPIQQLVINKIAMTVVECPLFTTRTCYNCSVKAISNYTFTSTVNQCMTGTYRIILIKFNTKWSSMMKCSAYFLLCVKDLMAFPCFR